MRESVGKQASREYFFAECLLDWFSQDQIKAGKFLLLLGEEPRELAYTDALGVPRSQIYSVERVEKNFQAQVSQRLGVNLHFGEMSQYLLDLLDEDREFLVCNLDVEGSYLSQLDSSMTPLMLLSWRKPETVVATYSSVGRDTEMLWEGVKSLAICLWLSPEATKFTFASLTKRYDKTGSFGEPEHMALRDFFWIRSMLEHTLIASAVMGVAAEQIVRNWFIKADMLWNSIARWRRRPLKFSALVEMVELAVAQDPSKKEIILAPPSCLGVRIQDLRHLVYNAQEPWSQLCYFARLQILGEVMDCRSWLNLTLHKFLDAPLLYANRQGKLQGFSQTVHPDKSFQQTSVWSKNDLYEKFIPRNLGLPQPSPRLIKVWQAAVQTRREEAMKKGVKQGLVDPKGNLTEEGKQLIQAVARRWSKATSKEIAAMLPREFRRVPEGVIRAHVAVGRRN